MNRSEAGRLGWEKIKKEHLAQRAALSEKTRLRHEQEHPPCEQCSAPIPYEKRGNRFCSSSCFGFWTNARRKKPKGKACLICEKPVKHGASIYCSNACHKAWQRKQNIQEIVSTGMVSFHSKTARQYLAELFGWKCALCGITQWQGQPTPLVLDHIDGNSDNNKLTNLRLICPNCDAQTPTYKAKNRGKGRHTRRTRYQNGQSY
jgi:predicted nucleic acid-binding Zn ribbon protein